VARRDPFVAGPIIFAAFVEKLGLLPGVFATTFVATLANRKVNLVRAALTSLCALKCSCNFHPSDDGAHGHSRY
jgi:hypothetical protein